MIIEFYPSTEFPEELSRSQNGFSVDVLVYVEHERIHTVGWYNFNLFKWHFLTNENVYKEFQWRYFKPGIDFPIKQQTKMAKAKEPDFVEDGIKIEAELIRETKVSYYMDCEGDPVWFPISKVKYNAEKKELEVPLWLMREKFPNENF